MLEQRILKWKREFDAFYYSWDYFWADLFAAAIVCAVTLPKTLAYAKVAGLPLQYGLYSSTYCVFFYSVFGTSKFCKIGPTALLSLIVFQQCNGDLGLAFAVGTISGVIQILMGILKLGVVMDLFSIPVLTAFTTSSAVVIIMSQCKDFFGLTLRTEFYYAVYDLLTQLPKVKTADVSLACVCFVYVMVIDYACLHSLIFISFSFIF